MNACRDCKHVTKYQECRAHTENYWSPWTGTVRTVATMKPIWEVRPQPGDCPKFEAKEPLPPELADLADRMEKVHADLNRRLSG